MSEGKVQGESPGGEISRSRGTVAVELSSVVQINDRAHASDWNGFHRHTPVCYDRFCGMRGDDRDLSKEVWCGAVRCGGLVCGYGHSCR